MQLAMSMGYAGGFKENVRRVQELEKAGLDIVHIPYQGGAPAVAEASNATDGVRAVSCAAATCTPDAADDGMTAVTAATCHGV